jgi:hypothetical protein
MGKNMSNLSASSCVAAGQGVRKAPALRALFPLGKVHPSRAVVVRVPVFVYRGMIDRHARGDWGDLTQADQRANAIALMTGDGLLSCYSLGDDHVVIITNGDRSHTHIQMLSESVTKPMGFT